MRSVNVRRFNVSYVSYANNVIYSTLVDHVSYVRSGNVRSVNVSYVSYLTCLTFSIYVSYVSYVCVVITGGGSTCVASTCVASACQFQRGEMIGGNVSYVSYLTWLITSMYVSYVS